jgi:DNA (cytosine-5)-methyltransferase 1
MRNDLNYRAKTRINKQQLLFEGMKIKRKTKNESHKITMIDLFAGIGGFHLAFNDLGMECVFASEWDAKARETYQILTFQK